MTTASLTPDYFERIFAADPDPWNFETSPYEAAKHAASVDALGGRHYRRGLEIGCANGVLTRRLAPRCDAIVALDVSDTALARARLRNADAAHIDFRTATFPRETPNGQFDLIVMSEVVYYWNDADVAAAGVWVADHLDPCGDLLLVHWTGDTDYPQTGDAAVAKLHVAVPDVTVVRAERHDTYRLDLWRKA